MIQLEILNCNNIDQANINLVQNKLNIKFGANGTGKSTIAKAIDLASKEESSLDELMPFKLRGSNPDSLSPEVSGIAEGFQVLFFNEVYVNQFVFKPDELVQNSFDIFIKTPSYEEKTLEINSLIAGIKKVFTDNQDLDSFLNDLTELNKAFRLSKSGEITKNSTGAKALSKGNNIKNIPEGLESFQPFLHSPKNVSWLSWQLDGHAYSEMSESCPFCTESVRPEQKERIKKLGENYNKTLFKNLSNILKVIENLGGYFSENTRNQLDIITSLTSPPDADHLRTLAEIKGHIEGLISKLEKLKQLSVIDFGQDEKVVDKLQEFIIDLGFVERLNSAKTEEIVSKLNGSLEEVKTKAGRLQGEIAKQQKETKILIEKYKSEINSFLEYAGYSYSVVIEGNVKSYKLQLRHKEYTEKIDGGDQHLSFGERNAFAIVLFMYECLSKKPDLIILDDPISSFDKNKKYAIMNMLFRQKNCLKAKTVLMLTHDIEPVIDTIKVLQEFNTLAKASFLKNSRSIIEEVPIQKEDILTFPQICLKVVESNRDDLVKVIYLRRLFEIVNDGSDAYQVLSNLFHKRVRELATDKRLETVDGENQIIEQISFENGVLEIQSKFTDFNYEELLNSIRNEHYITNCYSNTDNGYEKLQLFRLLNPAHKNSNIRKFINETYHIENEFICQLDPANYDTTPQFVIDECDKYVSELVESLSSGS